VAGESYTQEQVDAMIAERLASETAGLKANQAELLKESKAAKAALKNYEGVDASEYKTLKDAAAEAERKRLQGEGDFKALEKQILDRHAKEIDAEREISKRYKGSLEEYLIDSEAIRTLAKYSDSPELLLPHVKSQMKVIEQDGKFRAVVVDATGNVRIGKQGTTPLSLDELATEMSTSKTFAPAFRGTGSSGGGAAKSHAGGGSKTFNPATATGADFLANLKGLADKSVTVEP
jgi:hypothetical protein